MHPYLPVIVHLVAICAASLNPLEARQAAACPHTPIQGCDISAITPPPSTLVCNTKGKVSKPDSIIRNTPCFASNLETCRDNCFQSTGCESFAFDAPMANCYLYGETVKSMGFMATPKSTSELRFWSTHCFTSYPCTTGPNLVNDPGFESSTRIKNQNSGDPTNIWEFSSVTASTCRKETTVRHSGKKAAVCNMPPGGLVKIDQQLSNLTSGSVYSSSLWYAGKLPQGAGSVTCALSVASIPVAKFSPCVDNKSPGCIDSGIAPVYRQLKNVTFQVHEPNPTLAVNCTSLNEKDGEVLVYLDDVSVELDSTYPSYPSPKACWTGEIHDPCDGASNGCTVDGFLVKCDKNSAKPSESMMIFENMCGPATGGPWTCHCINGNPMC